MMAMPSSQGRQAAAITIACAVALAGCTTPAATGSAEPAKANPSQSTEDCMFAVVVRDWAAIDEQQFIIYGFTEHEAYLGKLFFPTPDLINNIGMSVIDEDHNGRICGGSTDSVNFRNATIPGRNPITSLRKISEEEAKALIAGSKANRKKPGEQKPPKESPPAK